VDRPQSPTNHREYNDNQNTAAHGQSCAQPGVAGAITDSQSREHQYTHQ
jgi:hypothetical protein